MALPQVNMEGRAGADPDLRFSPNGTAVAHLRVAASSYKPGDSEGQWVEDKTCWVDVSAFGGLAENIAESVVRGDLLTIVGKLVTDEWNDRQTGEKRSRLSVLADSVAVSLKFRTVRHGEGRAERQSGGERPANAGTGEPPNPWERPANTGASTGGQADDPPF